ncbi:MAG: hypothetical protein ACTSX6_07040 [Candidatus Heimdallarchaeaceae archaeon]
MNSYRIIINAPPIDFSKSDLYSNSKKMRIIGPFIKAVSDAFFLSNNFRKNLIVDFCTQYESCDYVISFNGSKIKYLGPSFFSAAHLLLRAVRHIVNKNSKAGKLTPGITIKQKNLEELYHIYNEKKWVSIKITNNFREDLIKEISKYSVFLYNAPKESLTIQTEEICLGVLSIDEQIILTNYYLFGEYT